MLQNFNNDINDNICQYLNNNYYNLIKNTNKYLYNNSPLNFILSLKDNIYINILEKLKFKSIILLNMVSKKFNINLYIQKRIIQKICNIYNLSLDLKVIMHGIRNCNNINLYNDLNIDNEHLSIMLDNIKDNLIILGYKICLINPYIYIYNQSNFNYFLLFFEDNTLDLLDNYFINIFNKTVLFYTNMLNKYLSKHLFNTNYNINDSNFNFYIIYIKYIFLLWKNKKLINYNTIFYNQEIYKLNIQYLNATDKHIKKKIKSKIKLLETKQLKNKYI